MKNSQKTQIASGLNGRRPGVNGSDLGLFRGASACRADRHKREKGARMACDRWRSFVLAKSHHTRLQDRFNVVTSFVRS